VVAYRARLMSPGNWSSSPRNCCGPSGAAAALQHITASPGKIGDIARAAPVLTHYEHGYIT
jgi:hypothetical protein